MPTSPKCVLVTKPGYRQTGMSRGLLYIWLACDRVIRDRHVAGMPAKLTLTAGSNGTHSTKGPHYLPRVEAADGRSKDFTSSAARPHSPGRDGRVQQTARQNKRHFLRATMRALDNGPILREWDDDRKLTTRDYFGQLEHEGQAHEHFHWQVRKGHTIR